MEKLITKLSAVEKSPKGNQFLRHAMLNDGKVVRLTCGLDYREILDGHAVGDTAKREPNGKRKGKQMYNWTAHKTITWL